MNLRYKIEIGLLVLAVVLAVPGCSKSQTGNSSPQQASGKNAQAGQGGQWSGQAGQGGQGGQSGQAGQKGQSNRKAAVIPVQSMIVKSGLLSVDRSTAGIVSPAIQSQVATQVAGIVLKVNHLVGDWVKQNDSIVQLDDTQLKLTLANAEATYENAKINLSVGEDSSKQANPKLVFQVQSAQSAYDSAQKYYDSQKALYDLQGISGSQLDTAASQLSTAQANLEGAKSALDQNNNAGDQSIAQLKLSVKQAQNQLDQARFNLQNASIKAPFAGQIAAMNMQQGMYAGLNTPVFTLVSAERHISFNVEPGDTAFLKVRSIVKFISTGKEYSAKISQDPSSPVSGVVPMIATIDGLDLPFGSVGNITYRVPLAQGIIIPISSIETLANQNYIFTIENSRVVVKNVTITAEAGSSASVDGINDGDIVIVSPPPGLIPGSQVQATMVQDSTADQAPTANLTVTKKAPGATADSGDTGAKKTNRAWNGTAGQKPDGAAGQSGGTWQKNGSTNGNRQGNTRPSANSDGSAPTPAGNK